MKAKLLTPYLRADLWGGTKLTGYGKGRTSGEQISESWELSFVSGCESRLPDGRAISEVYGKDSFGTDCRDLPFFPVLTKFIDAEKNLSVQVHPSDAYALAHEGQYGKCEMWVILEAKPGAGLYLGMKDTYTPERIRADAEAGTVEEDLSFVPVSRGDVFLLPPGTVHAIGAGVLLFEIQQNSTLTYRLYDYKRKDKDGNERPLHLDRALKVADLVPYTPPRPDSTDPTVIGKTEYFTARRYTVDAPRRVGVGPESFRAFTVVGGAGRVDGQSAVLGQTFFVPAGAGEVVLDGKMEIIEVSV